jgi:signal transduction histidine kinase
MDQQPSALQILLQSFPGIKIDDAQETIAAGKQEVYPPETVLCHESALESIFYIILNGQVRVTKVFNDTEERVMKYLGVGDFFGEMAIIQNAARAATVTTTVPTTVLEIDKEDFARLVERSGSVSLAMAREVSRRLRENDQMAIEDLRLKANELAEAYQQLAEEEYARREFLSTIAHELRTPLMTINGFLQIVRMGMLQGEALASALESMSRNLEDITKLVNDILFLQEMDLILPEFQPTDIGAVAAAAVEQQRQRALINKIGIRLSISPVVPLIPADPKSLERAVIGILDNAIKFSPDGGEVSVEVGRDEAQVWIRIQDHGVGIPEEIKPRIFDRFYHLDEIGGHMFRGAGIGLSITRQVIEQHHGRINVQSKLDQGSTFTIFLPIN